MQLEAMITQDNRPIAFFSRKLSKTQTKYSVTKIELLAIVETLKEIQGMLWGQQIKVYTDHMNLIRDVLGLTSDRVYRWRLLLEEYAPEIVYIKGIHNTVADAISRLEYNPEINPTDEQNFANLRLPSKGHHWKSFAALWHSYNEKNPGTHGQDCNLNHVFANCSQEDEIYPLTAQEVTDAQRVDATIKHCLKSNHVFDKDFDIRLVDKTSVVCKNGRMVIPKPLQRHVVLWFHHYLQHSGWKGMRTTIRSITKSCKACQVNKKRKLKMDIYRLRPL